MALWKFSNLNKYGNLRSRIIHRPDSEGFKYNPKGFGSLICARIFRYESRSNFPPTLAKADGKLFLVPDWKEVHPKTTLNDIKWSKPSTKKTIQKQSFKYESKSDPGSFYEVTVNGDNMRCNCSGFWRVKDKVKGCTHIQKTRSTLYGGV